MGPWGPPAWDAAAIGWAPPPAPRRGARVATAVLAAALVAAVAGVGIGHAAWTSSTPPSNISAPPSNGGSGTGGSGTGGSGTGGIGGTGNGGSGIGGSGNGGAGNGGAGIGGGTGGNGGSGGRGVGHGAPANAQAIGLKVAPALVDINTTLSYAQEQAAGTGIVLTSDGEILTNNHVINGETSIQVTDIGNGKTYDAAVVGYDRSQDIAVVQLKDASGLTTANVGDSSRVSTGQPVVAVGNAGGTGGQPSIAGGSITSLNQSITASDEGDGTSEQLKGLIQSNTNIQPGDSGGSLVDATGAVIGVDTAASAGFSFQGGDTQGFSIPINTALSIVRQIEAGTSSGTLHVGATAFLGVKVSTQGSTGSGSGTPSVGATIAQVIANGAAAGAGLATGDTITSFGGKSVSSPTDLTTIIAGYHPGETASVAFTDSSGQTHTVTVTLGSGPPS